MTAIGEDEYVKAMKASLRLLRYRQRTQMELESRLRRKGFSRDIIMSVCARLKELRYLDDEQFSLSWLRERTGGNCRSAWLVTRELVQKGVPEQIAAKVVATHYDREEIFRSACGLAQRMLSNAYGDGNRVLQRVQRLFLRRGFNHDFIQEVLNHVKAGGGVTNE